MSKVILVYAHGGTNPNDPGAVNEKINVKERDFIKNFFDKYLGAAFKAKGIETVFVQQSPNWYSIDKLVDKVYVAGDIAISCHLNASATASSTGTETLHAKGSITGEKLAKLVQSKLVGVLGLKDRGLKSITRDDRGGRLVAGTKPPCILAELFFVSNENDYKKAVDKQKEMAEAIVQAVVEFRQK